MKRRAVSMRQFLLGTTAMARAQAARRTAITWDLAANHLRYLSDNKMPNGVTMDAEGYAYFNGQRVGFLSRGA